MSVADPPVKDGLVYLATDATTFPAGTSRMIRGAGRGTLAVTLPSPTTVVQAGGTANTATIKPSWDSSNGFGALAYNGAIGGSGTNFTWFVILPGRPASGTTGLWGYGDVAAQGSVQFDGSNGDLWVGVEKVSSVGLTGPLLFGLRANGTSYSKFVQTAISSTTNPGGHVASTYVVDGWTNTGYSSYMLPMHAMLSFRRALSDAEVASVMSWSATAYGTPAPPPVGGLMEVWNGTAWVPKPVKVWNGSAWVQKPVKRWNGSAWVLT